MMYAHFVVTLLSIFGCIPQKPVRTEVQVDLWLYFEELADQIPVSLRTCPSETNWRDKRHVSERIIASDDQQF